MADLMSILQAVSTEDCPLSSEARHLVMTMAIAADSATGRGLMGQPRLAARLGKSVRQLRRLLDAVNGTPNSPVRIDCKPRFRNEGRGRTSNEYTIHLEPRVDPNVTPSEQADTGVRLKIVQKVAHVPLKPCPPARRPIQPNHGQSTEGFLSACGHAFHKDTHVPLKTATNRTSNDVQPDIEGATNRTPMSGHISTKRSTKRSTKGGATWKRVPQDWQPNDAHRALATQLRVSFQSELESFRDHDFSSAKRDPDGTFRNWLRRSAQFQRTSNRAAPPQRGLAPHVKTGTLDDL